MGNTQLNLNKKNIINRRKSENQDLSILFEVGDILWKLTTADDENELIKKFYSILTSSNKSYLFKCKYFNPIHYIILSSLWINSELYPKLIDNINILLQQTDIDSKTHISADIVIKRNEHHTSATNVRTRSSSLLKKIIKPMLERQKSSMLVEFDQKNSTNNFKSFISEDGDSDEDNDKKNKVSQPNYDEEPIEIDYSLIISEKKKPQLNRSLTYYIMNDKEKQAYDMKTPQQLSKNVMLQNQRISKKLIWFEYALYNPKLYQKEDLDEPKDYEVKINIGEMNLISIVSFIKLNLLKYSSIPNKEATENLNNIYNKILEYHYHNNNHQKENIIHKIIKKSL